MAIKKCSCKHEKQDKLHGEGKRVFNECQSDGRGKKTWKCTVCGKGG